MKRPWGLPYQFRDSGNWLKANAPLVWESIQRVALLPTPDCSPSHEIELNIPITLPRLPHEAFDAPEDIPLPHSDCGGDLLDPFADEHVEDGLMFSDPGSEDTLIVTPDPSNPRYPKTPGRMGGLTSTEWSFLRYGVFLGGLLFGYEPGESLEQKE